MLPAAVAVGLVFPFHGYPTPGTDRKAGNAAMPVETADMCYWHWLTKGYLLPNHRGDQQVVWRQVKAHTELFQGEDRGRGFAAGDVAKVSGTELASLGSSLIAEVAGITQSEDGSG